MKNLPIKILATGFGLGYSPLMPGTCGSLLGVLLFTLLRNQPKGYLVGLAVLVTLVAIVIAHQAEKVFGKKDAQTIVIDEVAGQLITYLFIPFTLTNLVVGFVLFRFFDIIKLFPARWVQDNMRGGLGVVGDDVVAGVQGGIILFVIGCWL
ncbi:MAG: phosphatidylglycerophosphatase A [Deltaproteobacteria bacterium]|nr:phosphatidylglycerophosphatase A [Deltaproteobacteria bacterium]